MIHCYPLLCPFPVSISIQLFTLAAGSQRKPLSFSEPLSERPAISRIQGRVRKSSTSTILCLMISSLTWFQTHMYLLMLCGTDCIRSSTGVFVVLRVMKGRISRHTSCRFTHSLTHSPPLFSLKISVKNYSTRRSPNKLRDIGRAASGRPEMNSNIPRSPVDMKMKEPHDQRRLQRRI